MSSKPEVEISRLPSEDISGDDSTPYSSWSDYSKAVKEEIEPKPKLIKTLSHDKYEFNVDKALDSIDLTFKNYTPSKDAVEFFNIIRIVQGEDFEVDNSIMQYFLVDLVFSNVTIDMFPYSDEVNSNIRINKKKIAIIASRFSAKSTLITAFIPIYVAITGKLPGFGKVMFWVSFGDSQQAGAKVQANTIRDICEDSLFCKEYFEKMRFTDEECEFIRRGTGRTKDRAFMFKVKGAAGGSVRGIRYKTARPQIFTFDDIIKNEADASSEIIMAKLRSMIYSDAENALGKTGKIIIVNTPFNKKDPVYAALESGVWTPLCIPLCEKISLTTTKAEYVGSWEAMKTYEEIMEKYEDAFYGDTLREFNQELMLRIANEEDRLVPESLIQFIDTSKIVQNAFKYNWYLTTDYTSTGSKGSDYSGAALWAVAGSGDIFLINLTLRKLELEEQYRETFNMIEMVSDKVRWVEVGVEVDGQQNIHIYSLKKLMAERNTYFSMARQKGAKLGSEGIRSKLEGGSKHWRFRQMLPMFQNRKIWFSEQIKDTPDMVELMEEIRYTSYSGIGSKFDDGIDLISQVHMIDITFPSKEHSVDITKQSHKGMKKNSINAKIWDTKPEEESLNLFSCYS